ncbi:CidA/LrgA family protein [Pseudomonas typographi]|uniref:CidA/LrgA family protein n=1 Tax=Pseudomonas typographi TaxID=2715964 RepID=A0ABR7Z5B7_9PSED|nr:CidA/LrgA family protein [Pseudomonas typographi]MBD1600706.1 CidA/LrgA family protein [Pseudomonas typographi]
MIFSLATLLILQCVGEGVTRAFNLPIPGPIMGMMLLLLISLFRPALADPVELTATALLRNMSIFFVPAGVGIVESFDKLQGGLVAIFAAISLSTALAIGVTALVARALLRFQNKRKRVKGAAGNGSF